jgi:hypothetical protein
MRRPSDQRGGFESGDSSTPDAVNEQATAISRKFLMHRQVMFAVRDGQLAQLQGLRLARVACQSASRLPTLSMSLFLVCALT